MSLAIDRLAQASPWRGRALTEKSALALGLLALALILPPWPGAVLVLLSAWGAALLGAKIRLSDWVGLNLAPMGFILTGALAIAVDMSPDGLGWAADHGRAALAVLLRSGAAVACLLLLAATTPAPDMVRGLRRLGLPTEIAEIALLTWRFIFQLLDAAAAIRTAQEARLGWHGWRRSIRSLGLLIAMLLPRAMESARRLEMGLAARGFDGNLRMLSPASPTSIPTVLMILTGEAALAGASLWLA